LRELSMLQWRRSTLVSVRWLKKLLLLPWPVLRLGLLLFADTNEED
jgi:hypothetical protein